MNKYLHAISANFLFFAINTVFFLVITPLAIRIMGDELFGLWTILYAIALFSNVGTLGITAITNKFSAEYSEDFQEQVNTVLTSGFIIVFGMALVVSVILLLTRSSIAGFLNTTAQMQLEFETALLWVAIGLLPQFLTKVIQGFFLSQYQNTFVRSMEFLGNGLPWIGAVFLTAINMNLIVLGVWLFCTQLIVFLSYLVRLQFNINFRIRFLGGVFRKMLDYSRFLFFESLAASLFQQLDRILVGFFLGPATAGVYAVGTSIGSRLPIITGQATEIMIPYASTKDSLGDHQRLYATFRMLSQYISALAAVVGVFLVLFMDNLLAIWISPAYATRYSNIFSVIVLAYTLISFVRSGHQTLTGLGQVRFTSTTYLTTTLIMLILLGILASHWGLLGAAVANLYMVLLLAFNLRVYRVLSEGKTQNHILRDLGLPVLITFIAFGVSLLSLSILLKLVFLVLLWTPVVVKVYQDKFLRLQFNTYLNRLRAKNE